MICTVTLNPAYDKAVLVKDFIPHEMNEIIEVRFDPGGKGINVTRVVHEMGRATMALGIIGGDTGLFIKNHLESIGIATGFVEIDQPTRTNLTIIDEDDPPVTELNEPGPIIDEKIILDVEKKILDSLNYSKFFVFAGSLPQGCPPNTYNRLIGLVRNRGAVAILDTRNSALIEGIKAKPFMIKPNQTEASQLLGRPVSNYKEAAEACVEFNKQGINTAIISLGDQGAVMACPEGVWKATPPKVQVNSAVGSGDSLVAGVCIGMQENMPMREAFKLGVACGTATATTPGTALCKKETVQQILQQIQIEDILLTV